jgi:hypothetical protein
MVRNARPAIFEPEAGRGSSHRYRFGVVGLPHLVTLETARLDRQDITDQIDAPESKEPTQQKDPTESSEAKLPIDPTERAEPTEPIESTEFFEAMERNEPSEAIDHRDGSPGRLTTLALPVIGVILPDRALDAKRVGPRCRQSLLRLPQWGVRSSKTDDEPAA